MCKTLDRMMDGVYPYLAVGRRYKKYLLKLNNFHTELIKKINHFV